jgi:aspartyl-tRNA(Asn)/glutamyl-tRNA(Gln) amidotransferase subunit A
MSAARDSLLRPGLTPSLRELAAALEGAYTTSEELVEECLTKIGDQNGEGTRTFIEVNADGAREAARAMDALRHAGAEPAPYARIPVSVARYRSLSMATASRLPG